ncbi:MAG: hypothetical protein ACM3X3_01000 [Betaproteobacteria bacterium]
MSTSEEVSKGELESVYGGAQEFFEAYDAVFMQLIRYDGPFEFGDDVRIDISRAPRRAYQVSSDEEEDTFLDEILRELEFRQ